MHVTLFRILAVLHPGPAAAADLLARIRALDGEAVPSLPTFYRHLREGVDLRWIEIRAAGGGADTPGRPSQGYLLTPAGARAMRAEAARMEPFTRLAFEGGPEQSERG